MGNNLNITPANFGLDDDKAFLHDPAVYIKVLDDDADDDFHALGYLKLDKNWSQNMEYAELTANIPEETIRKDAVKQTFMLEGALKQIQPETIALLSQRYIDDSGSGYTRVIMGSKLPSPVFVSVELITQTVDGKALKLRIRKGQITAEDFQMILGAKEHAEVPFKIQALKDTDPYGNNPDWDYYGNKSITADTTSSDATLSSVSFGTVDNIKIGGRIMGDGIPDDTTVLSVDYTGNEIEMSANATATDTGVSITVETDDGELDNIAHWYFED